MDYQKILEIAKSKIGNEFPSVITDIERGIRAGATGGEIIGTVGKYLKDLEQTNPIAYDILKEEIQEYLNGCSKIGHKII